MFVDLGAEQLLAAEEDQRKIAVEVKSFLGHSEMADLEQAIGQFTVYHTVLLRVEPDRTLFLAVDEEVYNNLFEEPNGKLLVDSQCIQIIVFDPHGDDPAMDITEPDRRLIETILAEYAKVPYSHGDYQLHTVFDRERDHYLLMIVGWDGIRREHGCMVHVDIIYGKFWIQRDGREYGISQELLDAGVPKDRIVLHSARWRSGG